MTDRVTTQRLARLLALGVLMLMTSNFFLPVLTVVQAQTTPPFVPDELLIKLRPNIAPQVVQELLTRLQAKPIERLNNLGWVRVRLLSHQAIPQMATTARQFPQVAMAEPNYILHANALPNDPSFSQLWALNNTGQTSGTSGVDIDAPEAWGAFVPGGNRVVVAVIDSGIDHTHADLSGRMWSNPKEIADNGLDDDQNGYVDDIRGWDFVNNDNDPADDYNHGTHVAGTIAAAMNNNVGVAGVAGAANVRLMSLKFLNKQGSGTTSDAIKALDYATSNGAALSNNSWGGSSFSQALSDAITRNGQAGGLFVAAAGNNSTNTDSSPYYPQAYNIPSVISVGSMTSTDTLSSFSNYGTQSVDLAAPGTNILSTVPGGYKNFSGTSMATPHVVGALALMWAQNYTLTNLQAKQILLDSTRKAGYLSGKVLSGGVLNLKNALQATGKPAGSPPTTPPPPAPTPTPTPAPAPSPGQSVPTPQAPSSLTGQPQVEQRTHYTIRSAHLTWKDNSNNETGFEIWSATSATGSFRRIKVTAANITSWNGQISRQPLASDVYYKVRAANLSGTSGFTNTVKINRF